MRAWIVIFVFLFACTSPGSDKKQATTFNIQPNWVLQESGVEASLRGIFVVDKDVVWASGSNGTFLKTVDGGINWFSDTISGYTNFDFRDIEAFDSLTAIVMGIANPAVILKTTDGGKNWKQVYYKNQEGIFLNSMIFRDKDHGFVVGDPIDGKFFLLVTRDGGETWQELPAESRPLAEEGEYMFAASGTCIASTKPNNLWFCSGGSIARIFHSKDDGYSWEDSNIPVMSGTPSSGIFSILFPGDNNGYCIGGDYARPDSTGLTFMFTNDNGGTWHKPKNSPAGYRSCIKELKVDGISMLIAVGREGTGYSIDGGQNWQDFGANGFYTLDVDATFEFGWAAGADGKVARLLIE